MFSSSLSSNSARRAVCLPTLTRPYSFFLSSDTESASKDAACSCDRRRRLIQDLSSSRVILSESESPTHHKPHSQGMPRIDLSGYARSPQRALSNDTRCILPSGDQELASALGVSSASHLSPLKERYRDNLAADSML